MFQICFRIIFQKYVQKSLLGNAWRGPTQSQDRVSEQISQIIKIPIQVSKVLARLGVSPNNVENFYSI